jgi:hypothetical protein
VDETDKGRVVLVDELVPADGPDGGATAAIGSADGADRARHAHTCRIRIHSDANVAGASALQAVRAACAAHPGHTPLFLHLLLPDQEIVVKASGATVDAGPALIARVEALLGSGSVLVEYARRT